MKTRLIQLGAITCILSTTFPSFTLAADGGSSSSSDGLIDAPNMILAKPTPDQVTLLNSRLSELQKAADGDRLEADSTDKDLGSPGDCGSGQTKRLCLEKQLAQAQAALPFVSAANSNELNVEITALQAQLGASDDLRKTADALTQTQSALDQMLKANDFSFKQQFTDIWKAFLGSWKYMIKPGPLVAIMSGGAGYGAAELSPLDSASKNFFDQNHWPTAMEDVGTFCGYGLCLLPVVVMAYITKDPQMLKATDALAVGTADLEAIIEPMKYAIRAPRPDPEPAGSFDPYGTPSAHAAETGMLATVLCHYFGKTVCGVGIATAAFTGLMRAAAGMHFPSQIFLGYGIGVMVGLAADASVDEVIADEEGKNVALYKQLLTGRVTTKNGDVIQFGPEMDPDGHHVDGQINFSWGNKKP